MITPEAFVDALKKEGFTRFTGVPCSFFQAAVNRVLADPSLRYTIVPNEGAALALAAGSALAGRRTAVLIQNSGFGNLVNPLTSLNLIYRLPVLVFMSGRAYGVADEPQHEIMGKTMGAVVDALGVAHKDLPADTAAYEKALKRAVRRMDEAGAPFIFFVRKDTVVEHASEKKATAGYPLKRIDAIQLLMEALTGDELVVATTGKPSRELFSVADRPENFYMQGSMGHAASIGLGVALERPDKKVIVLDGDGAALMHLGILSSIGHYAPKNFYHVVLDNESYETTGDQDTTSPTTDLAAIARSAGYRRAENAAAEGELRSVWKKMLSETGPAFLRVKINRLPTDGTPRISSKYDSPMIAARFKAALEA